MDVIILATFGAMCKNGKNLNRTRGVAKRNRENLAVTDDWRLVAAYIEEFERQLWAAVGSFRGAGLTLRVGIPPLASVDNPRHGRYDLMNAESGGRETPAGPPTDV